MTCGLPGGIDSLIEPNRAGRGRSGDRIELKHSGDPSDVHSTFGRRPANRPIAERAEVLQVIVYGHSALFYWWPLWVAGYVMALLTWLHHDQVIIGNKPELFHPSQNLGVIYTLLFLLLIVITSTNVRGMKAALIIVALGFVALLFALPGMVGRNPGLART